MPLASSSPAPPRRRTSVVGQLANIAFARSEGPMEGKYGRYQRQSPSIGSPAVLAARNGSSPMKGPSKSKEPAQPNVPFSVTPGRRPETNLAQDDQGPEGNKRVREPFFGHGAAPILAELIISVGALGLLLIVLLLAASVKERTSRLLFEGSQHYSRPQ